MPGLTDHAESLLLTHFFRRVAQTRPSALYLELLSEPCNEDGTGGTEIVGTGYARQLITFGAPVSRQISNSASITFNNTGSEPWPRIVAATIRTAQTGGTRLVFGPMTDQPVVQPSGTAVIAPGDIRILFTRYTTYLAHRMLDWLFRNVDHAPPSVIAGALQTTAGNSEGTGGTEVSATGYTRKSLEFNAYDATIGGIRLTAQVDYTTSAPVDWGDIRGVLLTDSLTIGGGNALVQMVPGVVRTVSAGGICALAAASTALTLD